MSPDIRMFVYLLCAFVFVFTVLLHSVYLNSQRPAEGWLMSQATPPSIPYIGTDHELLKEKRVCVSARHVFNLSSLNYKTSARH